MLLVTGATGFLGQAVMRQLRAAAEPVRIVARSRRRVKAEWDADIIEGDLLDPAVMARAMAGCRAVLHLAAVTYAQDAAEYQRVNVEGTRRVLEAAGQQGVARIIFASTWVADARGGAYAASKQSAEALVFRGAAEPVVVRLSELYSAEGGRGMQQLASWMQRHRWVPVIGTGRYLLAPLHVDDAAAALINAWRVGYPGRVYTVTGPELLTYDEMVDRMAKALGVRPLKVRVPVWAARALAGLRWRRAAGVAPDQIDRLTAPRSLMASDVPQQLGVRLRSWSHSAPFLAGAA